MANPDIIITVESQAPRATKELKDLADQSLVTLRATKQLSSQGNLDKHFASIDRQISRVNANMSNYSRFTSQAASGSNRFGVVTQQAGYQVGDFLVQIQSGTNWMVAFGQQATQLVGVLPLMTGAFGLSSSALIGLSAGLGIAIPLVTAIGAAFMRTGGEAKDTTTVFREAEKALSDLAEVSSDFERASASSFRVAKQEATSFLEVLRSVRSEKLNTALEEAMSSTGISQSLKELDAAVESIFSAEAMSGVGRSFSDIRNEVYATSEIFGLTADEAARLDSILKSVGGTTKEGIADSFFVAVERIKEANLLSDQTKVLIDQIASNLGLVEQAYEEIDSKATSIYSTLNNMTLVDLSKPFSNALPAMQGFLGKVLEMADAYAQFGVYVIPGTATPRGKAPAGGMDSIARAAMAKYTPNPFGKVSGGAAGPSSVSGASGGGSSSRLKEEINLTVKLTEAEKERQSVVETVNGTLEDGFLDMVKGTKTVGEAFRSMAAAIIEELFRVLVVQKLVAGITSVFTGGGAGGFTNAQASRLTGGGRASGGSMMSGQPYLVGENGPELVIPRHSGTVLNANQTSGAMAGSGGITVQNNITVTGSDAAMVRQEVAKMIPQITNATKAAVIDAKQRGGQMGAAFR